MLIFYNFFPQTPLLKLKYAKTRHTKSNFSNFIFLVTKNIIFLSKTQNINKTSVYRGFLARKNRSKYIKAYFT